MDNYNAVGRRSSHIQMVKHKMGMKILLFKIQRLNKFILMKNTLIITLIFFSAIVKGQKIKSIPDKSSSKQVVVYTTALGTNLKLTASDTLSFFLMGQPFETQTCIFIDTTKKFQSVLGIGGAITDASAETFAKLPADKQQEFLNAYFNADKGIGYTLIRTTIHSCDFSSNTYTYIKEGDADLKTFNINHDKEFRIPFIKKAMEASGNKLTIYASPWSPPAFMKDNNDILHGGKLLDKYYASWANYFVKFIKSYQQEGIPIWGVTMQNEPMANQRWESCIFSADDEKKFLVDFLAPAFAKEGLASKKIIGWDHNRDLIYQRASSLLNDKKSAKLLWGIGFHWYEPWSGGEPMYDNVKQVHESFPNTNLLFTEGCKESFDINKINDWSLGEKYGTSMIHDFNNGTVGFTDWNILLDENGGPNHVGNYCFAPIHANTKTGELIYTNEYYYIGHFSKFIRPDAKRISCNASRSSLLTTAFINKDGKVSVIVMNKEDREVEYFLWLNGSAVKVKCLPHAIQTLVF